MPALNELYAKYRDRVAFYVVYIEEAHPVDFWQSADNLKDGVLVHSAGSLAERSSAAETCVIRLAIKPPALLDRADNAVERAYTGWPDRLYLVDRNGNIAYKSAAGPFGFKVDALRAAIER